MRLAFVHMLLTLLLKTMIFILSKVTWKALFEKSNWNSGRWEFHSISNRIRSSLVAWHTWHDVLRITLSALPKTKLDYHE